MEELDIIKEFLIESDENLVRLDQEIIDLERNPGNPDLIASIFRTIHTIKGTCGFLGFAILTEVSHSAESILSQVREGKRLATKKLINIILESIDAIKQILKTIELTGSEGNEKYTGLVQQLHAFAEAIDDPIGELSPAAAQPTVAQASASQAAAPELSSAPVIASSPAAAVPVNGQKIQPLPAVPPLKAANPSTTRATEPEAPPPKDNASSRQEKGSTVAESSIRVDVGVLDKLMNLVGELVLARNQVLQFSNHVEDAAFNATTQRLNLITSELQESVMKTRMQPVGIIWSKFPRVVRDIASSIGKEIALTMDGADTELDRTIIEAIKDPLTHIIRNSCDHGIEKPADRTAKGKPPVGRLSMRAFHEGGYVVMEIADDGGGISPDRVKNKALQKGLITPDQAARMTEREAINTIFLPGFSTAEQVSNISGRGVGMDVVKTNIERIGGGVDITSIDGRGTTIKIKIPLTLAIIPGLVVTSGDERFIIPQVSLSELVRLEGPQAHRQIETVHNTSVYRRRGNLLPLAYLNRVLDSDAAESSDVTNIVVLQTEGHEFGLIVDDINDTQEIVVKPLGKHFKCLTVYSGATIMGDGKIALILDVLGIAQRAGIAVAGNDATPARRPAPADEKAVAQSETLLLFAAGNFTRVAVPLSKVARLEELPPESVERAAGKLVTQYRDQLLPLLPLVEILDPSASFELSDGKLQVVVFTRDEGSVGVIVDRIIDIIQEHIVVRRNVKGRGLLGSAVIGSAVTDLLDLSAIFAYTSDEDNPWNGERDLTALSHLVQTAAGPLQKAEV